MFNGGNIDRNMQGRPSTEIISTSESTNLNTKTEDKNLTNNQTNNSSVLEPTEDLKEEQKEKFSKDDGKKDVEGGLQKSVLDEGPLKNEIKSFNIGSGEEVKDSFAKNEDVGVKENNKFNSSVLEPTEDLKEEQKEKFSKDDGKKDVKDGLQKSVLDEGSLKNEIKSPNTNSDEGVRVKDSLDKNEYIDGEEENKHLKQIAVLIEPRGKLRESYDAFRYIDNKVEEQIKEIENETEILRKKLTEGKIDYKNFDFLEGFNFGENKNTITEKDDNIDMFEYFKEYYAQNNYDSYTYKGSDENRKKVNKLFEKGEKFYSKFQEFVEEEREKLINKLSNIKEKIFDPSHSVHRSMLRWKECNARCHDMTDEGTLTVEECKKALYENILIKARIYTHCLFKTNPNLKSLFFPLETHDHAKKFLKSGIVLKRNEEEKEKDLVDYYLYVADEKEGQNGKASFPGIYKKGLTKLGDNEKLIFPYDIREGLASYDIFNSRSRKIYFCVPKRNFDKNNTCERAKVNDCDFVKPRFLGGLPMFHQGYTDPPSYLFGIDWKVPNFEAAKETVIRLKSKNKENSGSKGKFYLLNEIPAYMIKAKEKSFFKINDFKEPFKVFINPKYLNEKQFFDLVNLFRSKIDILKKNPEKAKEYYKECLQKGLIFRVNVTEDGLLLGWNTDDITKHIVDYDPIYSITGYNKAGLLGYNDFLKEVCDDEKVFVWYDDKSLEKGQAKVFKFILEDELKDQELRNENKRENFDFMKGGTGLCKNGQEKFLKEKFINRYMARNGGYINRDRDFTEKLWNKYSIYYEWIKERLVGTNDKNVVKNSGNIDKNVKEYQFDKDYLEGKKNILEDLFSEKKELQSIVFPCDFGGNNLFCNKNFYRHAEFRNLNNVYDLLRPADDKEYFYGHDYCMLDTLFIAYRYFDDSVRCFWYKYPSHFTTDETRGGFSTKSISPQEVVESAKRELEEQTLKDKDEKTKHVLHVVPGADLDLNVSLLKSIASVKEDAEEYIKHRRVIEEKEFGKQSADAFYKQFKTQEGKEKIDFSKGILKSDSPKYTFNKFKKDLYLKFKEVYDWVADELKADVEKGKGNEKCEDLFRDMFNRYSYVNDIIFPGYDDEYDLSIVHQRDLKDIEYESSDYKAGGGYYIDLYSDSDELEEWIAGVTKKHLLESINKLKNAE